MSEEYKTFNEAIESSKEEPKEEPINEFFVIQETDFPELNESEKEQLRVVLSEFKDYKIGELDEGVLGRILGGVAGFLVGPAVGKVIAGALGIQKGIVYDMLTSRLATAAMGAAIAKHMGTKR